MSVPEKLDEEGVLKRSQQARSTVDARHVEIEFPKTAQHVGQGTWSRVRDSKGHKGFAPSFSHGLLLPKLVRTRGPVGPNDEEARRVVLAVFDVFAQQVQFVEVGGQMGGDCSRGARFVFASHLSGLARGADFEHLDVAQVARKECSALAEGLGVRVHSLDMAYTGERCCPGLKRTRIRGGWGAGS